MSENIKNDDMEIDLIKLFKDVMCSCDCLLSVEHHTDL